MDAIILHIGHCTNCTVVHQPLRTFANYRFTFLHIFTCSVIIQHIYLLCTSSLHKTKLRKTVFNLFYFMLVICYSIVKFNKNCLSFKLRSELTYFNYYHSFLFTNWCTRELLLKGIKVYIEIAPTCSGAITIIRERIIRAC